MKTINRVIYLLVVLFMCVVITSPVMAEDYDFTGSIGTRNGTAPISDWPDFSGSVDYYYNGACFGCIYTRFLSITINGQTVVFSEPTRDQEKNYSYFDRTDGEWHFSAQFKGEGTFGTYGAVESVALATYHEDGYPDSYRVTISFSEGNNISGYILGGALYDGPPAPLSLMNAGLNDGWYEPATSGQGFFITVFPDLGTAAIAWFTYDTELPGEGVVANLGDAGHRWLTGSGEIVGNQAIIPVDLTSGGLFDTPINVQPVDRTDGGTFILTFDTCSSGTVEYDMPTKNPPYRVTGIVPIVRVANDNIALCEMLAEVDAEE